MNEGRLHRLSIKLSGLHATYLAARVLEHGSADRVLALHRRVRQQMSGCRIEAPDDIDAVLEAADWARALDPHFTDLGAGSFSDLTSKALEAIWRRREEQEATADRMLQAVLSRGTRTPGNGRS
jgi:hypothetical protein